jgi:serine/threonine protein kinase
MSRSRLKRSPSLVHVLPTPAGATAANVADAQAFKPLTPGAIVGGRVRAQRKLAAGGMGEVWIGEHVELKLRVAIKVLRSDVQSNHEVIARFWREAFLLGQIHSEHVARVIDFISSTKFGPALIMEFVEGPSLAEALELRRFSVEEAIDLGMDVATALRELHAAHVVHRDVKPPNIILRPTSDGRHRAVFVDLGVGRLVPERECEDEERLTEITSADRAVGTLEYMAPEQILSSRDVTASADLYALGAILFRAICGRHVFGEMRGWDLARRRLSGEPLPLETGRTDRVAKGLEAVVARTLARAPNERYQVADEVLADLGALRDACRRTSKPSTPPPLPPKVAAPPLVHVRWAATIRRVLLGPRGPLAAAIGVLVFCAAIVVVGLAVTSGRRAKPQVAIAPTGIIPGRCALTAREAEPGKGGRLSLVISCDAEP